MIPVWVYAESPFPQERSKHQRRQFEKFCERGDKLDAVFCTQAALFIKDVEERTAKLKAACDKKDGFGCVRYALEIKDAKPELAKKMLKSACVHRYRSACLAYYELDNDIGALWAACGAKERVGLAEGCKRMAATKKEGAEYLHLKACLAFDEESCKTLPWRDASAKVARLSAWSYYKHAQRLCVHSARQCGYVASFLSTPNETAYDLGVAKEKFRRACSAGDAESCRELTVLGAADEPSLPRAGGSGKP